MWPALSSAQYVQTCLATLAIDRMAARLNGGVDGQFDRLLYRQLNNDKSLVNEIMISAADTAGNREQQQQQQQPLHDAQQSTPREGARPSQTSD